MRTLVCFGRREIEDIEVSTGDMMLDNLIVSRELFPTVYEVDEGKGSRKPSCAKEDIRLFHPELWTVDFDDDDDDEEELRFVCEESIASEHENEEPLFRVNPAEIPQRKSYRSPSKDVIAVIDRMERVLNSEIDSRSSSLVSCSNMMKSTMARLVCTQSSSENEEMLHLQPEQSLEPVPVKDSSTNEARKASTAGSGSAWNRILPIKRLRKKKEKDSDTLLLIPTNFKDSTDSLAEDFGDARMHVRAAAVSHSRRNATRTPTKMNKLFAMVGSRTTHHRKKGRFLRCLFPRVRPFSRKRASSDDTVQDLDRDLEKDKTHIMSFEDDDKECEGVVEKVESNFRPHPTFRNDEELIDHLVKLSAQNVSLEIEEGLNWLQARVRSRSSSNSVTSKCTKASAESLHPIFSPSLLDPYSLVPPSPTPSIDEDDGSTSTASSVEEDYGSTSHVTEEDHGSTSRTSSFEANEGSTNQNESTPSVSSIEDFFSFVNDVEYSASSLDALMIEKDLEKLSSEELTLLLDAELDKLMRDGLA
jgi:hypothetical protein